MKRKKVKLIKFLETEEIKKFEKPIFDEVKEALNKSEQTPSEKIAIRDFAVISLVYACALRISEACNLTLNYLDLNKKQLYVIDGKGGDRIVPIPEPTIKILQIWLSIRPNWKNNPYVFTKIKGSTRPGEVRPLNQKYFNQLFHKLAEKSGVKMRDGSDPHPHTLRHSRAMEIYDNVENLEIIKKLLGHKNISTTQIYAQVRDSKIVAVQNSITGGLLNL